MKARKLLSWLLCLVLLLSLTACGAESMATDNYYANEDRPAEDKGLYSESLEFAREDDPGENRKWVITVDMDAETEDMDVLLAAIRDQVSALKGYLEDQNIHNGSNYGGRRYRWAELTIRIPADQVDGFIQEVAGISNIVSTNQNREDVTLQYVDTESRVKALEVEEARLLELLGKAENMNDLLTIESRLTEVRYEKEKAASRLRVYDNLVDYATIHLSISEVQEYTPVAEPTVWERIRTGFADSLEGLGNIFVELFVFILVASPYLLVLGVIAFVVIFCIRRYEKKHPPKAGPAPIYWTPPTAPKQDPPAEPKE